MRGLFLVTISATMLAGCGGSTIPPRPVQDSELVALEGEVRAIAAAPCGSCHTRGLPTAKRDALAVFDLAEERWSGGLEPDQWDFFYDRIEGDVTGVERATVVRFVAAAKARR